MLTGAEITQLSVLALELMGPRYRTFAGMVISMFFASAMSLLALLVTTCLCISCSARDATRRNAPRLDSVNASVNSLSPCSQGYLLRHWFALSLATSVPFVLLFSYYWIIPESPRWLLSKNRIDEAEVIVQRMARINGKTVPSNFLRKMEVTLRAEPITLPKQR